MSSSTSNRLTRVLVVDNHPITRVGFHTLFEQQPDIELAGEARGLSDAMSLFFNHPADIVMTDIPLQNGTGLELTHELLAINSEVRVLVCSGYEDFLYAERALRAGARGYINKLETPDHLLGAVRCVQAGRIFLSAEMTERVLCRTVGNDETVPGSPLDTLTDRELQVFDGIGRGNTTRQIAQQLHLSPKTIETYRENIKSKLGLRNATELSQQAIRWVVERELAGGHNLNHASESAGIPVA